MSWVVIYTWRGARGGAYGFRDHARAKAWADHRVEAGTFDSYELFQIIEVGG